MVMLIVKSMTDIKKKFLENNPCFVVISVQIERRGRRGRDRMEVGFTTIHNISS